MDSVTFYTLLAFLALVCLGFFTAAAIIAYRKGEESSFWAVINSMVSDPYFDGALLGSIGAIYTGQWLVMLGAVTGFIGYKTVATGAVIAKVSDNKYPFFDANKLNQWAAWTISTKTWMAIIGLGAVWYAGSHELIEVANTSIYLISIVSALVAANGYGTIATMITNQDVSKYLTPKMKKAQVLPVPGPVPAVPEPVPAVPEPVLPVPEPVPISQVADRIDEKLQLLNDESSMWAYLRGTLDQRITAHLQHMLKVSNGSITTIAAAQAIADKYLHTVLTEKDCAAINEHLGLPEVIHAYNDVDIMASFEQAYKDGRLPVNVVASFRQAAYERIIQEVIYEAKKRLDDVTALGDERRAVLMEFGISEADAMKAQLAGTKVLVWDRNHYITFEPFSYLGYVDAVFTLPDED